MKNGYSPVEPPRLQLGLVNKESMESERVNSAGEHSQRTEVTEGDIFNLFTKLNGKVGKMEEIYDNKMKDHETEFLVAYKGHTEAMFKEILSLRHQLSAQQQQMRKDQQVAKLDQQLAWFRDEALKLRALLNEKKGTHSKIQQKNFEHSQRTYELEQVLMRLQSKHNLTKESLEQSKSQKDQLLDIVKN